MKKKRPYHAPETIQKRIDQCAKIAKSKGIQTQWLIKPGTYTEDLVMRPNVSIRGIN